MTTTANRRPLTYNELVEMNNGINEQLAMHKFVTSHDERAMLRERNPKLYEKRRAMMDEKGANAFTLSPELEKQIRHMRGLNLEAQRRIAENEGADAAWWGNFYQNAETCAYWTRTGAVLALFAVGTVATAGALAAPLAGGTAFGMSAATLTTAGTVAFTGVTIANLSGKIAEGKQLDGGDYAEILLTVLPFGAGKAGLLLKETLGAARAAKAAKLLAEAEKIAAAEKTPIGKALEKVLQRTAAGREAVQDFVRASRDKLINPQSGFGRILKEADILKDAKKEAQALQQSMRQNMKDQKRLQQIADQLGNLRKKNPGITADIDPKLMKELEKKGIKLTNAWTTADGKVMAATNGLNKTKEAASRLRNIRVNAGVQNARTAAGNLVRKPMVQGAMGAGAVLGANNLMNRGGQNGGASEIPAGQLYAQNGGPLPSAPPPLSQGMNTGGEDTTNVLPNPPPAPRTFEVAAELQDYHAEISTEMLQKSNIQTVVNTTSPQETTFDGKTLHAADLSSMNNYWQQVSLTYRQQLVGMSPEDIAYYTGPEGKAQLVADVRAALAEQGIVPSGEAAPQNKMPDYYGGERKEFVTNAPQTGGMNGRAAATDLNGFPPRVDELAPAPGQRLANNLTDPGFVPAGG